MLEERIAKMNEESEVTYQEEDISKRIYTVDEIQDILGVSKTTAYHLVKSKVFHSVRVGGQYRISKRSFDMWLDGMNGGDE